MAEFPARERLEIKRQPAKRFPIAARIFEQRLVLRDPDMATLACEPAVHDDRCDLPTLARSCSIAKEEALVQPMLEKLQRAIDEVGTENGFVYIFDLGSGAVVFQNGQDVSQMVKTKLGITG